MGEQLREARTAFAAVFRNPALRRIQLAFAGSVIGDWAYAIAIAVYLYARSGAGAVGALGVVRFVAISLVTPFAATLADRFPRRLVMVVSDFLRAGLVLAAALVIRSDGPIFVVLLLAVLTSLCGTAFRPAEASWLPSLVRDPSDLTAANVASSTIESVGFFAGPAIAGLLLGLTNVTTVYAFNAATFVWSGLLVLSVRSVVPDELPAETDEPTRLFEGVGAGFATIGRNRDLRLVTGLYVVQCVVAGASIVYEVAIALDLLKMHESGLGLLNTALGVGGLVGGFAALVLARRNAFGRYFAFGVMLWSAPLLLVAASPHVLSAVVAMVLVGLGNSIVDVNVHTMVQRIAPQDVMARVFGALDTLLVLGMAAGAAVMPVLIDNFGIRTGLVVLGAGVCGVAILSVGGLVRVDRTTMAPRGLELMSGVPLFAPLSGFSRERLAKAANVVELGAGDILFHEGAVGDKFYVIESGMVGVSRSDGVTDEIGPGGHFGEVALLRDAPRNATITAITDVVLLAIERDVFLEAVTSSEDAMGAADLVVSRRLAFS